MKKLFLFFTLVFTALAANAGLFDKKQSFLKVDDAFAFSATLSTDKSQLQVHWDIANGYYLYQDKISAELVGKSDALTLHAQQAAELHQDPYFGEVKVFTRSIDGIFSGAFSNADDQVEITYQGCTEGFCYPPETKVLRIGDLAVSQEKTVEKTVEKNTALLSEQDRLADGLFHSKWAIFGFFLLGLGLAFTPCVLPMLPLLSAIVIGQQQRPNMMRAFSLAFLYVQGMALTYTLLGLAVAAIGLPFQIALQHPYVMIGLSILFVVLALSMFGLFTIQLPNSLQNKLNTWSQKQTSGAFGGSFAMGMIAGQVYDVKQNNYQVDANYLRLMHSLKTGRLIELPLDFACKIARKESDLDYIRSFGKELGIAYQIKDDILDYYGEFEKIGKLPSDEDMITYLSFYGIDECKELLEKHTTNAIEISRKLENNLLEDFANYLLKRDK